MGAGVPLPRLEMLQIDDPRRPVVEQALRARSLHLPVEHTVAWLTGRAEPSVLAVLYAGGELLGAVPISALRPRSMPGHVSLRATKLGTSMPLEHVATATRALAHAAQSMPRVLNVMIESYGRDPQIHAALCSSAYALGFDDCNAGHTYSRTIVIDLAMPEAQLFARIHPSMRRAIRKTARDGHSVRAVGPRYAARVDELHRETMQRTGGQYRHFDWQRNLEFAAAHPEQCRISGLFLGGSDAPENLVAVRWCFGEGERMRDCFGASTRRSTLPLMHAVIWDQMQWGQRIGASWFDFGGVPARPHRLGDTLDSIADFKRRFSTHEETVGHAVSRTLRPLRYAISQALGRAHSALTRAATPRSDRVEPPAAPASPQTRD